MFQLMKTQHSIHYGKEGLLTLASHIKMQGYSSLFVLTDTHTAHHCFDRFVNETGLTSLNVLTMTAGEEHKNLKTCETLWQELSSLGADRNSALINLGGGVVTDLGGFVACTFKRGIDFYNVPTSLLAMVDASVGGKTGIDFGPLKNQIGIIQEPVKVIIDSHWLQTLPDVELRSGFSEMLKHGLIADKAYWNTLQSLTTLSPNALAPYIERSVELKKDVVLEDPTEKHLRKILNYGHTLGHAIESYYLHHPTQKRLLHGEAIAIGMITEAYLSVAYCGMSMKEAQEIKQAFDRWFPKIEISSGDENEIFALLRHDKKNKGQAIRFVLLHQIGQPKIDIEVTSEHISEAFQFYADLS